MTRVAIDLGDPVPLGITIRDATGALANAGAVTCTVTQPDASTATPAVANPSTGTYTAAYTAAQAGRHTVRWLATGANAAAYTDVFDVLAADPRFVFGLAEARAALRRVAGDTSDDEELRTYIAAVTNVVEDIAGPVIPGAQTWTVDGGRTSVLLPSNVTAVTSVTENGTVLVPGVDYTVNLRSGILVRGSTQQPYIFLPGQDNIVVAYTVGAGAVPANVKLAARIILRHLWQTDQQGFRPAFGAPDSSTVQTPSGFAVPKRAMELLAASRNAPGFA